MCMHKLQMHLLIPAVLTCTVSRQLCPFPAAQNHWALREYTSSIIQKFVNNLYLRDSIMSRIIRFVYKYSVVPYLNQFINLQRVQEGSLITTLNNYLWQSYWLIQNG